jgi:hypothetical protein
MLLTRLRISWLVGVSVWMARAQRLAMTETGDAAAGERRAGVGRGDRHSSRLSNFLLCTN